MSFFWLLSEFFCDCSESISDCVTANAESGIAENIALIVIISASANANMDFTFFFSISNSVSVCLETYLIIIQHFAMHFVNKILDNC